ncbi:MAG: Uma2 family endonuclease [Blastocatellia bacterium]|jgi:Uma2 family endonuclease
MALAKEKIALTVEEYLASERASVERHEYLDGLVYAMAGESPTHGTICTNLISEVRVQLKGTPCQAWSKDCKVRSGPVLDPRDRKGLFSYPDLVVFCGEPSFHDAHRDVLTNPVVIIEVLSPSTEVFDRGEKFARLRTWNPSLLDYLLVSQSSPFVEQFTRREDGSWLYRFGEDLSASLSIESIGCTLHLAEVYDRIVFPLPTLPEEVVTLEGDTT